MIILYATKPDTNGNTYKLKIDHTNKTFTTNPGGFFHRSDAVTVTKREYKTLRDEAIKAGYKEN